MTLPNMTTRMVALLLCPVLAGCTRVIDTAQPRAAESVGPITAGQVSDLLSDNAGVDPEPNLFASVEPQRCAGLAQEVDPPFIFATTPAAQDGGQWLDQAVQPSPSIEEMVGVYGADFDARAKLEEVKRVIETCQRDTLTVTTMDQQTRNLRLVPAKESGAAEIVLWSLDGSWSCDNAFIAAHNAAIELTTCAEHGGYDVLSLARDALKRIDALANSKA